MLRHVLVAKIIALLLLAPLCATSFGRAPAVAPPVSPTHLAPTAQLGELTHDYFVGMWETENQEFNRDVQIFLTLWNDSRLAYHFKVDGVLARGSTGKWWFHGSTLNEEWVRPDGSAGSGQGRIEKIDADTFRLTIIDNGFPEYKGLTRIYRRRGPPQLSMLSCDGSQMPRVPAAHWSVFVGWDTNRDARRNKEGPHRFPDAAHSCS